jgi:hypothetical protein
MSACRTRAISSIEHFIDQSHGTDVFHVQFEGCVPNERNVQLGTLFGVKLALDAVVHEGHEASRNDNTVMKVSWEHVVCRVLYSLRDVGAGIQNAVIGHAQVARRDPAPSCCLLLCLIVTQFERADVCKRLFFVVCTY